MAGVTETRSIRDEQEARALAEYLMAAPKPVTVTITSGPRRSLSQNALIHKWFGEIATAMHQTPEEIKNHCKAWHGVPILLAEDPEFSAFYLEAVKPLTVEQKLAAMRFIPVTSIMTKDQLSRFADSVFAEYTRQGIALTLPEDKQC